MISHLCWLYINSQQPYKHLAIKMVWMRSVVRVHMKVGASRQPCLS